MSGLTVKEADQETYQKYSIMANAAGEYQAYQTFMENGIYDMALDSLIRAVGRCDKYSEEAAAYGCSTELAKIRDQAVAGLSWIWTYAGARTGTVRGERAGYLLAGTVFDIGGSRTWMTSTE